MLENLPLLIIGGIVVLAAAIVILVIVHERRRRQALEEIAGEFGLSFSREDPFGIPSAYGIFPRLSMGNKRTASHVLHGVLGGTTLKIFDYKYVTGSGQQTTTHSLSVVLAETGFAFDCVSIRQEMFFDRLADLIGQKDTKIGEAEFDQAFRVTTANPEFAKYLLGGDLADFLLESPPKNIHVEFAGRSVLVHRNKRLSPRDLGALVKFFLQMIQKLPNDLPRSA